MDLMRLLGENVREARKRRHMSQEALALEADMKRSYLSELERGKRNPSARWHLPISYNVRRPTSIALQDHV